MNVKKTVGLVVLLALGAAAGWRVYLKIVEQRGVGRGGGARVVPVAIAPAGRETVRAELEFTGAILPRSRFVVAPKVPGRLERLNVNIGDSVRNGDLIAVLDGEEYAQQSAQARAEMDVNKAQLIEAQSALTVAERDAERVRELHAQRIASESELDEIEARARAARAKAQVAEAQIQRADAALKAAEVRLSYTRIHVSWEGGGGTRLVGERFCDEGAMLRANDPLVSIVDTESVLAVIYVIERDFPDIIPGQAATLLTDAYPGRTFEAKVARRAPVLDEASRHARVEIEAANPEGLLAPGMFARVVIEFEERADALTVPVAALTRRNGDHGVFLADTNSMTCSFVPVKTGILSGGLAEILSPGLDGALVVTLGHHLLEDGAAISLPTAGGGEEPGRSGGGNR